MWRTEVNMTKWISNSALLVTALGLSAGVVACSSDDSDGGKGPSFDAMASTLESPTGTVSASSVGPVAAEFEKVSQTSLGGYQAAPRSTQATQDMSASICTAGGSAQMTQSGGQSQGSVAIEFSDCCVDASCCYDGSENILYSDGSGTASYSVCYDYDLTASCSGETASLSFAGCLDASSGMMAYSVTVDGETFTVSGSYSGGSGTLTITGANGSWECTYTNDSGSCTGTGGDFTF